MFTGFTTSFIFSCRSDTVNNARHWHICTRRGKNEDLRNQLNNFTFLGDWDTLAPR